MAGLEKKSFAAPDEVRTPPKARMEIVMFNGSPVARVTYAPGWRWSVDAKPVIGTDSCQVHHFGYMVSGRGGARMNDGTEVEFGPGDVVDIPAGHDGWTIGDEPMVIVDFGSAIHK